MPESPSQATIRPAIPGEQGVLASLCAPIQELHARARPGVFRPVDIAGLERWFTEALADGAAMIFLAEIDATPVGYALVVAHRRKADVYCHERRWYEIDQLGVHHAYRRRGVARALARHVNAVAASEGVAEIELNTWTFNAPARAAFERLGFVPDSLRFTLGTPP